MYNSQGMADLFRLQKKLVELRNGENAGSLSFGGRSICLRCESQLNERFPNFFRIATVGGD